MTEQRSPRTFGPATLAEVTFGRATGNVITLKLKSSQAAGRITSLKERGWSQDRLILGTSVLAALTFRGVAITPPGK